MSDHEIHNEACGCWAYPPPVTVRLINDSARRGETGSVRIWYDESGRHHQEPCPLCETLTCDGHQLSEYGVPPYDKPEASQPAEQEAERAFEEWRIKVNLPIGLHPVELRAFTTGYRRGRAEERAIYTDLSAINNLRAENARLRKMWEEQGEAWKRDTRDAERIKGELSDKLAAAEQVNLEAARQINERAVALVKAEQRERRLREALRSIASEDGPCCPIGEQIARLALAKGEVE